MLLQTNPLQKKTTTLSTLTNGQHVKNIGFHALIQGYEAGSLGSLVTLGG
jgi:hypothetical protein